MADETHCRLRVSCTVTAGDRGWCCGGGCSCLSPGSLVSEQVVPGFLCPLHSIFDHSPLCLAIICHVFPGVHAKFCGLMSHLQRSLNQRCGYPGGRVPSLHLPYSMSLGMWPESIQQMWPSHLRCLLLRMANKFGVPAHFRTSVLVSLSCQEMWRMHLRQWRWKLLSLFSWLVYIVQVKKLASEFHFANHTGL